MNNVKSITIPFKNTITGYTRLDYIEGTGTQYFDTGFYPKPTTRVEIDFEFTDIINQGRLFGTSGDLYYQAYVNGKGYFAFAYNDSSGNWVNSGALPNTSRHKVVLDGKNKIYTIDNIGIKTLTTTPSNTANNSLYVFITNPNGPLVGTEEIGKFKLYDCKIYDNGTLVRHYIPIIKVEGSVPGVYDLVNDTFTQSAVGSFTAGNTLSSIDINKIEDSNGNVLWENKEEAYPLRLLEYIHLNGAEYLDTGLKPNYPKNRAIWIKVDSNATTTNMRVIGAYATSAASNARRYYFLANRDSGFGFSIGDQWAGGKATTHLRDKVLLYGTIDSTGKKTSWGVKSFDDQTTYESGNLTTGGAVGQSAYIFIGTNSNDSGEPDTSVYFRGNIYKYTIKNTNGSGPIENAMFPCQRKSDGVCGLYDVNTGLFHQMIGTTITDGAAGPIVDENWDLTTPQ